MTDYPRFDHVTGEPDVAHRLTLDEIYSRNFLIGSARTMKLQRALLMAFVAILVVLIAQGLRMPAQPGSQSARSSVPSFKESLADKRNGSARPGHLEQVPPAQFMP
jgi:hypothetical protein